MGKGATHVVATQQQGHALTHPFRSPTNANADADVTCQFRNSVTFSAL